MWTPSFGIQIYIDPLHNYIKYSPGNVPSDDLGQMILKPHYRLGIYLAEKNAVKRQFNYIAPISNRLFVSSQVQTCTIEPIIGTSQQKLSKRDPYKACMLTVIFLLIWLSPAQCLVNGLSILGLKPFLND